MSQKTASESDNQAPSESVRSSPPPSVSVSHASVSVSHEVAHASSESHVVSTFFLGPSESLAEGKSMSESGTKRLSMVGTSISLSWCFVGLENGLAGRGEDGGRGLEAYPSPP